MPPSRFDGTNVHYGYLQGLRGEEAEEGLGEDYEAGWLAGAVDREAGKSPTAYLGFREDRDLPIKQGDTVTIPKGITVKTVYKDPKPAGRTYKIKVNHIMPGSNAYLDWNREVVRPTGPKVVWPGPGGYWSEADLNDVIKEPT